MDVLAVSMALAAHVFPWSCHQYQPTVPVVRARLEPGFIAEADIGGVPRCEIRVSYLWYELTPGQKCHVIVHERGHLAGLEHTYTNPRSVMYSPYDGHIDRRCRRVLRHGPWWRQQAN